VVGGSTEPPFGCSFVSRANPKDAQRHVIVGMQSYKPRDFAAQMNISLNNGWGIVRMIVDLVNKQPDGRYVLVKDPNNVSAVVRPALPSRLTDVTHSPALCPLVRCACQRIRPCRGGHRGGRGGGRRGVDGGSIVTPTLMHELIAVT
jgi:hypothetical protein